MSAGSNHSFLTFKTQIHADHRSDAGFRCTGLLTIVARQDREIGKPVVDVHCQKCNRILALTIDAEETRGEAGVSLMTGELAGGVPGGPERSPVAHDGKVDNPLAPIAGMTGELKGGIPAGEMNLGAAQAGEDSAIAAAAE